MKFDPVVLAEAQRRALNAWRPRPALSLIQWAERHFVRSKGVDYHSGRWESWPFQRGIMAAIGDDRIEEVSFQKAARLGWSAMIRAAIGYFAQHKRRDQAVWCPTDSDRDKFSKKAIDSLLRDVACMAEVMPNAISRHKDNTLELKMFVDSTLHLLGGKAEKNYRDISVSVCILEEVEAFDRSIEGHGSPFTLAWMRSQGATFRKRIAGATPKDAETSLIAGRCAAADVRYRFQIPCPDCGKFHELTWLVDDDPAQQTHGLRWIEGKPESVRHLCPHCGVLIDQGQYIEAAPRGLWFGSDGSTLDQGGVFRNADGEVIDPRRHVAFHAWAAYGHGLAWEDIVREYEKAVAARAEGDDTLVIAFENTYLAQTYAGNVDKSEFDALKQRAEPFPLQICPKDCLVLLAGCDTQDNRLEATVWGYGRGLQSWTIDHRVFYGDPELDAVWKEFAAWLFDSTYSHVAGTELKISGAAIDSRGHKTMAVYDFARKHRHREVYAIAGRSTGAEKAIVDGATAVDIDRHGRKIPKGVILWHVGTNRAKDSLFSRLQLENPGPGYIHLSRELPDEWFRQMASEHRRTMANGDTRWEKIRSRNEAWDCATYATWLAEKMGLRKKPESWWLDLEAKVRPEPVEVLTPTAPAIIQAQPAGRYDASKFFQQRR